MNESESMPEPGRRFVVVGGGITGLAAAHRLQELSQQEGTSCTVDVLEARQRTGGLIYTMPLGKALIECGPDSFITNKPHTLALCRRLGLENELIETDARFRRSLILHKGRPVETPPEFQLLVPGRLMAVLKTPLLSPFGKLRLFAETLIPRRRASTGEANGSGGANNVLADESLSSFVIRRFGREVHDRIVQPLIGGIYTSDPDKLSLLATLPRFIQMEQDHRSLILGMLKQRNKSHAHAESTSGARYGLFLSLKQGMSSLINRLGERIQSDTRSATPNAEANWTGTIRLGTTVQQIQFPTDSGKPSAESFVRITIDDGTHINCDGVIVALPAYRAAGLIESFYPDVGTLLRQIEYAGSAIVVSHHKLADFTHPMDAFGLVIPRIEKRQILAVSFLSRKFVGRAPDGTIVLRTFVGGALQPELLGRDDDEIKQLVQGELQSIFGYSGTPSEMTVARWEKSMPQYHVGHLDRVAAIRRAASQIPRLALAGNAYDGVGIPDSVRSGESAAEQLWSQFTSKVTEHIRDTHTVAFAPPNQH